MPVGAQAVSLWAFVKRVITPVKYADGDSVEKQVRLDLYGGKPPQVNWSPTDHGYNEEGAYWTANSGVALIGTGVTWPGGSGVSNAQQSWADATPHIIIQNADATRSVYLRYLRLIATAATTAATGFQYSVYTDNLQRTFAAAGAANNFSTYPAYSNNMMAGGTGSAISSLTVLAQNSTSASVVDPSSKGKRFVGRGNLGGLSIVGDEVQIVFGSTDAGAQSATTAAENASQPGKRVSVSPACVIAPGGSASITFWWPSGTTVGTSFVNPEFELAGWVR